VSDSDAKTIVAQLVGDADIITSKQVLQAPRTKSFLPCTTASSSFNPFYSAFLTRALSAFLSIKKRLYITWKLCSSEPKGVLGTALGLSWEERRPLLGLPCEMAR
jgi:hypothetical protein